MRVVAATNTTAYFTTGPPVISVTNNEWTTFIPSSELTDVGASMIVDLQMLPNGDLLLLDPTVGVLKRGAAGPTTVLFSFAGGVNFAADSDEVAFVNNAAGIARVDATGHSQLYTLSQLGHSDINCPTPGFTRDIEISGEDLFYLPGCGTAGLYIARTDGSGAELLLDVAPLRERYDATRVEANAFGSIAAMPDGVVVNVGGGLIYVPKTGGFVFIRIAPSLEDNPYMTEYDAGPIDVSSNGRIWMVFQESVMFID